jgi:anti-anti-sigma regulatory factor
MQRWNKFANLTYMDSFIIQILAIMLRLKQLNARLIIIVLIIIIIKYIAYI